MSKIRMAVSVASCFLLFTLFVLAPGFLWAQVAERKAESKVMPDLKAGIAEQNAPSLKLDLRSYQISRSILLEPLPESAKSEQSPAAKVGPLLVGIGRDMPSPDSEKVELSTLQWIGLNGGGQAAALAVTSSGASAIRLGLSVKAMAEGIEIRFFSMETPEKVFGPYIAKDLLPGRKIQQGDTFWSPVIEGDTIGMEIYLPEGRSTADLSFSIPKISHLWTSVLKSAEKRLQDIGSSGSCQVDIACNSSWVTTGNSVVKYVWTSYPYIYMCTGNLITDTVPGTYIPYFLTANHCMNSQSDASNINTYWFFQKTTCGGPNPTSVTQQTGGANLLANSTSADYSLLRLNDTPPGGAVFAGWTTGRVSPGTSIVGIHHPAGDLKKISLGSVNGYAPFGEDVDGTGEFIQVIWSSGSTEGGSSGSGLWINSGGSQYLVGTLTGGYSDCSSPDGLDWYGRFGVAYSAISYWIDPGVRDLVIPSGTPTIAPSSVIPGETAQLSAWTVQNQGTAATGAFNNGIYLSTDATIASSDVYLDGDQIDSLAAGASANRSSQTLTIPADTLPGNYYIGILTDSSGWVTESNESNNSVSVPLTVSPPPGPDLRIISGTPTVTPAMALPGGTVQLSAWTVLNQGAAASGAFENGFYLSTDATITPSDIYLGGNSNPPLASGASTNWGAQTLSIPASVAPGTYYIGILADRTNAVAEWDEGNNYVSVSIPIIIEVQNAIPLSVSGTYASETYYLVSVPAGKTMLRITTSGGTGDVDIFVRSGSPPLPSTYDCSSATTGNEESCAFTNPSAGDWYIVLVGYEDYSGVTLTATYYSGQNLLQQTNLSAPIGNQLNFSFTLSSGGPWLTVATSGGTGDVDLYVKYGSWPTWSNYDCRPYQSGNNENCTFPNPSAGTWYVILRAYDSFSGVTLSAVSANPLPPVDLFIPSGTPTVTPNSVPPGGTVQLSAWTVQNQGTAASGAFENGFYLSTDATITSGDTLLASNSNPSLTPGASTNWGPQTLTSPPGTPPGNYYIGILADRNDVVAESTETNNYVRVALTVALPDLVISSGTPTVMPSWVSPGGMVQLSAWTVQNQGGTASGAFANGFYLSTDETITAADTLLASNSNPALTPGASTNWGPQTLTIPAGTPPGNYYIGILADIDNQVAESYEANNFVSVPLTVGEVVLQNGSPAANIMGGAASQQNYRISVPSGATSLTITVSGGTGDVDLYVKYGSQPTLSSFDCRSSLSGNAEICTFADPPAGDWHIMLYGDSAFSGVMLTANYYIRPPVQFLPLTSGGAASANTSGVNALTWVGYSTVTVNSGATPYGTAVFSFRQNGVTVTEAGVPASPPTTRALVFIDYRAHVLALPGQSNSGYVDINTGIAVVNTGSATANVVYTLSDIAGTTLAVGNGTIAAGAHFAKFISQLADVAPNFNLPSNFQTATQFGTLEISSNQPLSVLALRGTNNQRNDFLITTTPVADLTQSASYDPAYFPQFADGGGYTTSLVLLNTTNSTESGMLQILDNTGSPLIVHPVGSAANSSFTYTIPAGGALHFQTDGFPSGTSIGWVRLIPNSGNATPVGSGVFSYNPGPMLISESGIPSTASTTHARVYVDLSGDHNTGLAIANVTDAASSITIRAFQTDGATPAGTSRGPIQLAASGHDAEFANQFIAGLPAGFTGVLDISSSSPFAALTIRSLVNERDDFLMTTFPIADANTPAPSPIVFPQVVDGAGYITQVILISSSGACSTTLNFYDENGAH